MNAFLKKEIRLLLPGWLVILLLEVAQPWVWRDADENFVLTPIVFFFGLIIFAVDAFGREFSLGTFQSLLAQPIERRQIWRTKIAVLGVGAFLILVGYFASCELRLWHGLHHALWQANPVAIKTDFTHAMTASIALFLIALSGGLWTALWLRQIASAFWITFLAPAILLLLLVIIADKFFFNFFDATDAKAAWGLVFFCAALFYSGAGFWLARRLFLQAQDVAWTGGVVALPKWRYFESRSDNSVSTRERKPWRALLKKEFHLQSISLFCAGVLLALHLGIILLRCYYVPVEKNSFLEGVADFFWTLWLVLPLVISGTAVAEERKLGVAESQFCLPVSRRTQFALKFFPAIFFGVLLGGCLPLLLETLAVYLGAPGEIFSGNAAVAFSILPLAAGFSLAAFFASTLAKNFLQALSLAIVFIVGGFLLYPFATSFNNNPVSILGILPWPSLLPILIGVPVALGVCLWLVYRNFSRFHERGRLWRRNLVVVFGAAVFVFVGSALIYNRAWDMFSPAEPSHGAAIFSQANPPLLRHDTYNGIAVNFPDGRVWFNSLGYASVFENPHERFSQFWWMVMNPLPNSTGPQQFIAGSNWISTTAWHVQFFWSPNGANEKKVAGYLDTVGVRADGTLWISSEAKPVVWTGDKMIRFGTESNWQQVARRGASLLLLKRDGTLWHGGTNYLNWSQWQTNWPSLRGFGFRQIGTNTDWSEIISGTGCVRKTDGSVWSVKTDWKTSTDEFLRATYFDGVVAKTFSGWNGDTKAYVGADGILWVDGPKVGNNSSRGMTGFLPFGTETNWVSVAVGSQKVNALKSDGTLWSWDLSQNPAIVAAKMRPTRLGIHNDWVGLTSTLDYAVSLAADGSLWLWPDAGYPAAMLMKPTKQPRLLGNVLGKAE